MFAVFYENDVQAIFADRIEADDWNGQHVDAYPNDSSFDEDRAKWSVRPVNVTFKD